MKTYLLFGATVAFLGLATAPLTTQAQLRTCAPASGYYQASKIVGSKVRSSSGEEIGEIKDVVLDNNGCMAYTVVSTGGTGSRITGTSKTVPVPWQVYPPSSDRVYTVRVEKEKIYNAPVFEYSRINEYSTSGWTNNVYSYYGVSPGVGVSVGVSGSTTSTTGTTAGTAASTTASASPSASVSPTATASATATASPSATVTASPSATASASPSATASASATAKGANGSTGASASPSKKSTGRSKATMTPASSPRSRAESPTAETSGATSERTASPSTR